MSTNESGMADYVYAAAAERSSDFVRRAFKSTARYAAARVEVSPWGTVALVADSSMAPGDARLECRRGDAERISSRCNETSRVPRESNPTLADDSADWSAQLRAKVKASDERRARDRATPWDPWGDGDALSTNESPTTATPGPG